MPHYVRARLPGASYFFTVALLERQRCPLTREIDVLREAFRTVRAKHPFYVDAIVVLPDHLHCIWTLTNEEADYFRRWRLIKSAFARAVETGERLSDRRLRKKERGIRQRRFWEHLIQDEDDFGRHADYIHYNPVKHGWVGRVADWPYSSFHRWVRSGVYPPDWGAAAVIRELDLG